MNEPIKEGEEFLPVKPMSPKTRLLKRLSLQLDSLSYWFLILNIWLTFLIGCNSYFETILEGLVFAFVAISLTGLVVAFYAAASWADDRKEDK